MNKTWLWFPVGILVGMLAGFMLFGLQVLPKTEWTWSFDKPLELQGGLQAPVMLIDHNSDKVYYVTEYKTPTDATWELTKYYEFIYPEKNLQLPGLWYYKTTPIELNISDFDYQSMPPYYPLPCGYIGDGR
jgi:hypothetical protein